MVQNAEDQGKPDLGPTFRPDNGPYQKLVDHCKDLYKVFSESAYRKAKVEEIVASRKAYEQIGTKKQLPWEDSSNVTLPLVTITADNLEPRLVTGLIGRDPLVRFEMVGAGAQDEQTRILEAWFNQELKNEVKIESHAMSCTHTILLEGTYYSLPQYNRHEEQRRDFVFGPQGNIQINPETNEPVTQDKVDVLFEGGEIERIPFTDVFVADNVGTQAEWEAADKGVIFRPTYAELMRSRTKKGYLKDKIGPWLLPHRGQKKMKEEDQSPEQRIDTVEVTGKEVVKCINWFISYPLGRVEEAPLEEQQDFTEEKIIATVTEGGMLIRLARLREFNFSNQTILRRVRLFPEDGRSYGTSIYGKMRSIQDGTSDFFNAVMNVAMVTMIPWFFHDDSAGIRGDVELYPGKGVSVESVKGILIPDFFKLNPANYLAFINIYIDLWERLGNIANPQIGKVDSKERTATEIMTVIQEGNIKYDYQSRTTRDEFISILQVLYDLYYQYMPFNKTFRYNGKDVPLPRQRMRQKVVFTLSGATAAANRMVERKESEDLMQLAGVNPIINPMATTEDLLKAYGKTDLARYIKPEVAQLLAALFQHPELPQVIGKYVQDKTEIAAKAGIKVGPKAAVAAVGGGANGGA